MDPIKTSDFSSAVRLLLCCARTQINDDTVDQIRDLAQSGLDWDLVLQLAQKHMVLPLLYRTLQETVPNAVPSDIQKQLRSGFHANVRNSLLYTHRLLDLLQLFEDRNIPVVPFKGPVAAASTYGSINIRTFGDLDLLVHLRDAPRAESLLQDQGFAGWKDLPPISELDFDRPPSWSQALTHPFDKAKTYVQSYGSHEPLSVEVHWELVPPYFRHPLNPERFWERLRTVSLQGETVKTFSVEDTFFYFCLHGTIHRWNRLRLVCDVAELLRRHSEMDWGQVLDDAVRMQSERIVLLSLNLAYQLLEAPVPAHLQERMQDDDKVSFLTHQVTRRLFNRQDTLSRIWDACIYNLRIRDRLYDGIGLCFCQTRAALPAYFR